jgi:hypothetical protein
MTHTAHGLVPTVKGNTLHVPTFACARCHKASQQAGRGYRMHMGVRSQVCQACKTFIDTRRARGAHLEAK